MNEILKRFWLFVARITGPSDFSQETIRRYQQCVSEWNANYAYDDWCDSDRAVECKAFIEWFDEVHK